MKKTIEEKYKELSERDHILFRSSMWVGPTKEEEKIMFLYNSESELMEKYGVSRYTIRRAAGELESERFIYRVQGGGMYVDDWKKQRKPVNDSKLIGVITTHLADYIFPRIISGIDRIITENGYSLILNNTHNSCEREEKAIQRMIDNQV